MWGDISTLRRPVQVCYRQVRSLLSSWVLLIYLTRWKTLLARVQMSHFKSNNMTKLSLAIECYRGMSFVPAVRSEAMSKLTSMLLHPFPKVSRPNTENSFKAAILTRIDRFA